MLRDRKAGRAASAVDVENELALTITLLCAASSISWSHYYAWLLPAFAFAWTDLSRSEAAGATRARIALACAFVLTAPADFLGSELARGAYGPLTGVLSSYRLLGAFVLFGVLVWIRWKGSELDARLVRWRELRLDVLRRESSVAGEGRA
jgi:hypothetical protein